MGNKTRRTTAVFLSIMLLLGILPMGVSADCDTQEVKVLLDQVFQIPVRWQTNEYGIDEVRISGWDVREAAGSIEKGLKITDASTDLPIEMNRRIKQVSRRQLTMEFRFKITDGMNGVTWKLLQDDTVGLSLINIDGNLCLEQSGSNPIILSACQNNTDYGVKALLDLDTHSVSIYVNGNLAAANKPLTNAVNGINQFNLKTGNETVGEMYFYRIRIYRGYLINEKFYSSINNVPVDWTQSASGGSVSIGGMQPSEGTDFYSIKLDGSNGGATVSKNFGVQTRHLVYEFSMYLPEKINGANVSVANQNNELFGIKTSGGSFCYKESNGTYTPFYTYVKNLWYTFKVDLDLPNSTAKVYCNGKLINDSIALNSDLKQIDNFKMSVSEGSGGEAWFDDIYLYPFAPEPADYVPEPEKVESSEFEIGAQVCSLWTEGTHFGWDWINATPERKPYLGFYDEISPELSDWEIKFMVEHGISYQMYCWYRPYVFSDDPIKEPTLINDALHNGFFNAKYSDKMKFMIMWENGYYTPINANKDFEENIVPYWIEYYFKDPRYLKYNNRPVVSFYRYNLLLDKFGGIDRLKQAFQYLKDKCNEAGIGDPILVSSGSQLYERNLASELVDVGITAGAKYIRSVSIDDQKEDLKYERDECLVNASNGIDFELIPTLSMGWNDMAWVNHATGTFNTPEEYEDLLSWTKNELNPTLPESQFGKRMILLATWNEFGEGHFIQPTKLHGFGYLDAVRKVFIGDFAHEDIVPNDAQKSRFNNLYPSDRTVPLQKHLSTPTKPIPQEGEYSVIKGWYFNTDGNTEGWVSAGDIQDLAVGNGHLFGIASGTDPKIVSSDNLNIDLTEVDFLKLRQKVSVPPLVGSGTIYYTKNDSLDWQEGKSHYFSIKGNTADYVDYWLPINWTGTLKQLRVDPIAFAVRVGEDNFSIDSIELINSTTQIIVQGTKLSIDTEIKTCNPSPITMNNRIMVPVRALSNALKAKVDWDEETETVGIIKGDNFIKLKIGEDVAYKNGEKVYLDQGAIIQDGSTFVPIRFVGEALGVNVDWSEEKDTVFITSKKESSKETVQKKEKREIIYSVEFDSDNDFEGCSRNDQFSSAVVAGGVFKGTVSGNDAFIHSRGNLEIDAASVKNISIGLQNETGEVGAQLFFVTDKESNWDEAKTFNFPVKNEPHIIEYNINTATNEKWKDNIMQFRFDPTTRSGEIKIDYIRFEGDVLKTEFSVEDFVTDVVDNSTHITKTSNEFSWEFDTNGPSDGWSLNTHLGNIKLNDGRLTAMIVGPNPMMETNGDLKLDTSKVKNIKILYKNSTQSDKAKLYFITDEFPEWNDECSFEIDVNKNDTSATRYTISTLENPLWKGTLKGLRFNPASSGGNIYIDYIRMELSE